MQHIKLLTGNAHPELARLICKSLNMELGECEVGKFSNGETSVMVRDSVRGSAVYIIQSTCASNNNTVNDNFMELLIMVDAVKLASATKISAVIPYLAYGTSDKKDKARVPITTKLVANMLESAGVGRVLTVDLHSGQVQGFFDCPVDNLYPEPLFAKYARKRLKGEKGVICALKPAQSKRAVILAEDLCCDVAFLNKSIAKSGGDGFTVVGDVKDKVAVIVQDIADSCGHMESASYTLIERGAKAVYAIASHAIFSEGSIERITRSAITELAVTNTIPLNAEAKACPKIKILNIAPLLAEVIRRQHHGESVTASDMFTIL